MRLKKTKNEAEEDIRRMMLEGYQVVERIVKDIEVCIQAGRPDELRIPSDVLDNPDIETWKASVIQTLEGIFPTSLEAYLFKHKRLSSPSYNMYISFQKLLYQKSMVLDLLEALRQISKEELQNYPDLLPQPRLYIEDIDSFSKVRNINPAIVNTFLKNGYLNQSEESIQLALEEILDESFHRKDWGGEINDLYTANVWLQGNRVATAFMLKGNGLKNKTMEIGHCGKNGDQLVRLFESPAKLFIVQFVGQVSENIIKDVESKVNVTRGQGREAWYCIMNGQDTARLLYAYGHLK